jgi:hypothetical protein
MLKKMTPSESYSTKVHSGVVRVSGLPATFATAGEKPWKEAIGRELARIIHGGALN